MKVAVILFALDLPIEFEMRIYLRRKWRMR